MALARYSAPASRARAGGIAITASDSRKEAGRQSVRGWEEEGTRGGRLAAADKAEAR